MSKPVASVALVGDIFFDHIMTGFKTWPAPGEEAHAAQYKREVGGGAAITGCALARLGHQPSLFAAVGNDSEWILRRLRDFGLRPQGPTAQGENTGVTFTVSSAEDRTFFTYYGANRYLHPFLDSPSTLDSLAQSRHVHFALPISHQSALALFQALRGRGCTVSLDIGWQMEWLENSMTQSVLRSTDLFFPNEKEAALLTGGSSVPEMLNRFAESGVPHAVIKLGQRGAASLVEGESVEIAPPKVEVQDPTGAGDAFDAGFIDAYLEGVSIPDALRRACICGALSTRSLGALSGLPTRDEVLSFL